MMHFRHISAKFNLSVRNLVRY